MIDENDKPYWRDVFGKDEVVQRIRPEYCHDFLCNPHKGTTTFQRFQGDPIAPDLSWDDSAGPIEFKAPEKTLPPNQCYMPYTRISYCRWPWAVIEPDKGKFRWDYIDKALESARIRKQTLQVRMEPYTTKIGRTPPEVTHGPRERTVNMPPWYWATGATWCKGGYTENEPDHNDPRYLEHFGDFIRAFAARHDGHPDLESLDVAYGGFWGEGGGNASTETAARLVDVFLQSFKRTQLVTMLGTHGCTHAATSKERNVGWRADCFGDMRHNGKGRVPDHLCWCHMRDAYPESVEQCGVKDAWKTAPVIMESCGTVASWFKDGYDIDWIIEQGYKYHMSVFMPKSVYFPKEWMDRLMGFEKRIGYRFHLHQMIIPIEAKASQKIEVKVCIDNKGVAPIYRPYQLALRFSQGRNSHVVRFQQDIRKWLPDLTFFKETIEFPKALERGEVKVSCAIVNEKDLPVVKLAIKPKEVDGWHHLTSMDVV